jgi:hypothetical protein
LSGVAGEFSVAVGELFSLGVIVHYE